MEFIKNKEARRKSLVTTALLGGIALGVTGCGAGSSEVLADIPVEVLDKSQSERFVSEQESPGYPHYEDVYHMTVEQCGRDGEAIADEDGCVDLEIKVGESTYDQFSVGDHIVFEHDQRGYAIE